MTERDRFPYKVPSFDVYHSSFRGWAADTIRLHGVADAIWWGLLIFLAALFAVGASCGCSPPPRPSEPEARSALAVFDRAVAEVGRECASAPFRSKTRLACERPVVAARDGVRQALKDPSFEKIACAAASVRYGIGEARDAMEADGLTVPVSARTALAQSWPLAEHARCYPESPTSSRSWSEDPRIPRIDPKPEGW